MTKSDTREQVEAAIIQCIAEAEAQGVDGITAATRAFPGTPDTVLWGLLVGVGEPAHRGVVAVR